jgi:DNA-binding beta-propeller fold protein YncE
LHRFALFAVLMGSIAGGTLAAGAGPASPPVSSPVSSSPGPSMVGAASRPAGEAGPVHDRIVREGIAVEVSIDPVAPANPSKPLLKEGDEAVFRFRITDTTTGTPLSSLTPAAWLDPAALQVEAEAGCQEKVKGLLGGSSFAKPELDLTGYQVLALNEDSTITVVDPFFGFGGTKLLAMLFLDSPGEDWALAEDGKRLFVTLPATGHLAVADTEAWKVTSTLDVGSHPRRVAFQPDQGYLWVAWEGTGSEATGVSVIDPRTLKVAARIVTGRGGHEIAFSDDSRFAFVTNRAGGTVSVIDVRRLAKLRDLATGAEPVSVAWTGLGHAAWVSHAGGALVAVDGERPEPLARVEVEPGLGQIAFAPGGRFGFVVAPRTDRVHILDVSRNRVVQTAKVGREPDAVAFSSQFAYVRHRGSETVLMIPLGAVGEEGAAVSIIDFPGGEKAFGAGAGPAAAAGIVPAPGSAQAVLVANPADQTVYYYKEGMAAPMGSFANYSRQPRAVLVVDRSLRERAPGVYETTARLRHPGQYELAFFLDAPRVVDCLRLAVDRDPEKERQRRAALPPRVEYLLPAGGGRIAHAGRPFPIRLRILDGATGEPRKDLTDVTVLSYQPPGTRQIRQPAVQVAAGIYEAALVPDAPGSYYVYVQSLSQGLGFRAAPALTLEVEAETGAPGGAAGH